MRLEPKVMEVLVCLARQAGEPVSKEELLQTVWPNTFVTDDGLKRAISELRRVFEDDAREPRIIETIPKRGYRLLVPVEPLNLAQASAKEPLRQESPAGGRNWRKLVLLSGGAAALVVIFSGAFFFSTWQRLLGKGADPQIHSIAVLPLENLSGDPNQDYFSDGMTDALITDLAQLGSLKVVSRTSSLQYKQAGKSLPEIGRELGVDGIIEGTVQKSGDRVRITAQLIYAPSDKHLWAHSYERDMRDVLALERNLAEEIVNRVQGQIGTRNNALPRFSGPANYRAFDAYLQGNYHLARAQWSIAEDEKRSASRHFEQAIDADPDFVPAYLGLANAHSELALGSSEDTAIMKKAAEKVLALDPSSAEAWDILGHIKWAALDWAGAEQDYRRAIALSPNRDACICELPVFLGATGRLDESLREAQISQGLNPEENSLSFVLEVRGDHEQAIDLLQREVAAHPTDSANHYGLFRNYAETGMYKEAVQELESDLTLMGAPEVAAKVHRGFAVSGYQGAMREYAKALEAIQKENKGFFPENLAVAYTALGEKDRAFYWLEQAYEHREKVSLDWGLMILKEDRLLDGLRSDPRFRDLLRRAGLPQ